MTDSANEPMGDSLGYCRSGCARNRGYRPAAQRNQPTQTLKGFHSSAVCRTPSAFIDNPTANPGCAARPGALLLKSFGLSFTPQKSKTLRVKVVGEDNGATGVEGLRYHDKARGSVIRQTIEMSKVLESLLVRSGFGLGLG